MNVCRSVLIYRYYGCKYVLFLFLGLTIFTLVFDFKDSLWSRPLVSFFVPFQFLSSLLGPRGLLRIGILFSCFYILNREVGNYLRSLGSKTEPSLTEKQRAK